jgi:hypothetical protein
MESRNLSQTTNTEKQPTICLTGWQSSTGSFSYSFRCILFAYIFVWQWLCDIFHKEVCYVGLLDHCDPIPKKSNLRGERFILVYGFRGFSPSRWGGHGAAKEATSGCQEAEKGTSGRGQGKLWLPRHFPVTYFLHPLLVTSPQCPLL